MYKSFVFALFGLLFFLPSHGQYAVLKDKDGFINVREKGDAQSKIKDTLHTGRIVYFFEKPKGEWFAVDFIKKGRPHSGFVHRSRVHFIVDFVKFKRVLKNDSIVEFRLDSFFLSMKIGKFQKEKRVLKFEKGSNNLISIDGKTVWGADANIPKKEYRAFTVSLQGQVKPVEPVYWVDVFEPNLNLTDVYFDKELNTVYIYASNSDGAGAYVVLWLIREGNVVGREIDVPF